MFIENHKRISRLELTINFLEELLSKYAHLYDSNAISQLQKEVEFYKRELKIRKTLPEIK